MHRNAHLATGGTIARMPMLELQRYDVEAQTRLLDIGENVLALRD